MNILQLTVFSTAYIKSKNKKEKMCIREKVRRIYASTKD